MGIPVKIGHDGAAGDPPLTVSVVTVGRPEDDQDKRLVRAGESTTVTLNPGQFVMLDETDEKEGT